jgi:phosphopantothenoylcysteine decarboxylase/phosphopantothenate--cysteine ligase
MGNEMTSVLDGRKIILGISGGIAVYKTVELLRLLQKQGARVRVVMTENAKWFVGPTTFEALTGQPVCWDLFREKGGGAIGHIDLAVEADAVVVAPATANIIAKMAGGIADDALSTFLLAVTAPVIVCPAMNTHMYENPATQRNLRTLREDGRFILDPAVGELACGTSGAGRLPDADDILDRVCHFLTPKDLAGKNVLVTAGPTREYIDPVRFISNPSSGKMGYAIARAAEYRGAAVTLVTGPTQLASPAGVETIQVESAREMAQAVFEKMDSAHIIIKSAAVGDYRPVETAPHKIKKDAEAMTLNLEKNTDILLELGRKKKDQVLVGFAAETQDLVENACSKLERKNLDMIVGNLVNQPGTGFGVDTNRVTFFYRDGRREELPEMEKLRVAHTLLDRVHELGQGEKS